MLGRLLQALHVHLYKTDNEQTARRRSEASATNLKVMPIMSLLFQSSSQFKFPFQYWSRSSWTRHLAYSRVVNAIRLRHAINLSAI